MTQEDIPASEWPYCVVPGCRNRCCLALNSIFCFPHTPGNQHVKRMKIDAENYQPADAPDGAEQQEAEKEPNEA